jgi:NAD(P)-dependent dehydrogenase (short-subunit alcohol dehydrogenase family)
MAKIKSLSLDVKNKIVAITGGYGYLGCALTQSFIDNGAIVYVLGKSEQKFKEAFSTKNNSLLFVACDVSESKSIKKAFNAIFKNEKRIDVLVNNAFYSRGQSPENMTDEDFLYGLDGTLRSTFSCIREIIPFMKKANTGVIINVSSMYGMVSPDFKVYKSSPQSLNPPHYGAAKAGIIQLTRYYANYLAEYNIRVNCVTPGPFPSEETKKNKTFVKELSNRTSLNRVGLPEEVAGAFVFLASEAARFITGQNIIIDGGWTSK